MKEHTHTHPLLYSYDARIEVEKVLEAKGLLRGKENNKMRLGVCSRSGDIIEPYLTPQWCVRQESCLATLTLRRECVIKRGGVCPFFLLT